MTSFDALKHFKYATDFKDTKEKKGDKRTDKRTNGRTNLVTKSLLELLVAAKNLILVFKGFKALKKANILCIGLSQANRIYPLPHPKHRTSPYTLKSYFKVKSLFKSNSFDLSLVYHVSLIMVTSGNNKWLIIIRNE